MAISHFIFTIFTSLLFVLFFLFDPYVVNKLLYNFLTRIVVGFAGCSRWDIFTFFVLFIFPTYIIELGHTFSLPVPTLIQPVPPGV